MRLQLRDNLPFVSITLHHHGKKINIKNVLVDTGSGGTILAADVLSKTGKSSRYNRVIIVNRKQKTHAVFLEETIP